MAWLRVDRSHVGHVVSSALGKRDDVVGLIRSAFTADMTDAAVSVDDELRPLCLLASACRLAGSLASSPWDLRVVGTRLDIGTSGVTAGLGRSHR
jgi:hypothetical protein